MTERTKYSKTKYTSTFYLHEASYRKKMNLKINELTCTSTATDNIMVTAIKAVKITGATKVGLEQSQDVNTTQRPLGDKQGSVQVRRAFASADDPEALGERLRRLASSGLSLADCFKQEFARCSPEHMLHR